MSQLCPCGSALSIAYVASDIFLAIRLHRIRHTSCSRYTAFVIKDADYLIKTWHPSCHAADFRQEIEAGFTHTQWLGLTVFESSPGSHDDEGFVSFVARFTENNKPRAIIERSRFLKESGQWYYIDGTRLQFVVMIPRPCGSGKI